MIWRAAEFSVLNFSIEYNPHYLLWCDLNNLLCRSPGAKHGQLSASGWFEVVIRGKNLADFPAGTATDAAVLKRTRPIARSREFEIARRPQLALFNQEKYLQPYTSFNLKMFREEAKKALRKTANNADEYKIIVRGCTFWVRKVTAHPGIQAAHTDILANPWLTKYPSYKQNSNGNARHSSQR